MTETVAFLVAVRACPPDQLGTGDKEVLIDVIPGAGEDARSAGAPLEANTTISGAHEVTTGGRLPFGQSKDEPTRPQIQGMMGALDP